jgi:hypothetical protein
MGHDVPILSVRHATEIGRCRSTALEVLPHELQRPALPRSNAEDARGEQQVAGARHATMTRDRADESKGNYRLSHDGPVMRGLHVAVAAERAQSTDRFSVAASTLAR